MCAGASLCWIGWAWSSGVASAMPSSNANMNAFFRYKSKPDFRSLVLAFPIAEFGLRSLYFFRLVTAPGSMNFGTGGAKVAFFSVRTEISVFTDAILVVLSIVWKIKIVFVMRGKILFTAHVALHTVEKSRVDREMNCIARAQ